MEKTKHYWQLKKMSGMRQYLFMFTTADFITSNDSYFFCRVQRMCSNWESALSHGLKTTSVFKNIVSGNLTTESPATTFWDFAFNHLTTHEKERFSTLRYGLGIPLNICYLFVSEKLTHFFRSSYRSWKSAGIDTCCFE